MIGLSRPRAATAQAAVSSTVLLLDAQDLSTLLDAPGGSAVANGASIGRVTDKSGTGRHADQATLAAQPTRSDGAINGHTAVASAGAQGLVIPTLGAITSFELWIVLTSVAGTQVIAETYNGGATGYFSLARSAFDYNISVAGVAGSLSAAFSGSAPALVRVSVDTTLATGAVVIEVDGVAYTSGANAGIGTVLAANPIYLGRRYDGTYASVSNIGEVRADNRVLTTAEANARRTELQTKWGL